jgi:hypothetical protein
MEPLQGSQVPKFGVTLLFVYHLFSEFASHLLYVTTIKVCFVIDSLKIDSFHDFRDLPKYPLFRVFASFPHYMQIKKVFHFNAMK